MLQRVQTPTPERGEPKARFFHGFAFQRVEILASDALFAHNRREDVTVGACHARARAKGVDTSPKSSGGAVPLTEDRPVTSGDIMTMFQDHAERRAKEAAAVAA